MNSRARRSKLGFRTSASSGPCVIAVTFSNWYTKINPLNDWTVFCSDFVFFTCIVRFFPALLFCIYLPHLWNPLPQWFPVSMLADSRGSRFEIPDGTHTIVTHVFRGFCQTLQANSGVVCQTATGSLHILSTNCIINSIQACNAVWFLTDRFVSTLELSGLLYVPRILTFHNFIFCSHSEFLCFVWLSE